MEQMSTDGQMIYPFIKCGISTIVKYYSALKRKEKGRRMGQVTACVDPEGIMWSNEKNGGCQRLGEGRRAVSA